MQIDYRWIKNADGALDAAFVEPLARHFGIRTFIETGTYRGDTLAALRPVFDRLLSVELSTEFAREARARFIGDDGITIIEADSARGLAHAFAQVPDEPAFIWLDAHYSGGPTAKGDNNTPILAELNQILEFRDGKDIILIDDARLFWPVPPGFEPHETLTGYPVLGDVADHLARSAHAMEVFVLGDALLATPRGLTPSNTMAACTRSRLAAHGQPVDQFVESAIKNAVGAERDALSQIAPLIEAQRAYGLGGHYFYWRGVLREQEQDERALKDFSFAARCGVVPDTRCMTRRTSAGEEGDATP